MARGLASKAGRFFLEILRSPRQALSSLPARLESLRMRARGNSIFRRPEEIAVASNCPTRMLDAWGGLGHLNEQEPAYWIAKLAGHGFTFDQAATDRMKAPRDLHYENVMIFVRQER